MAGSTKLFFSVLIFLYRVPGKNHVQRELWIEEIEKYQAFDHYRKDFSVCIRHFREGDVQKKGLKNVLKPDAVPSIFRSRECVDEPECSSCASHEAKIVGLMKQIKEMTAENLLSSNKLKREISTLQKLCDRKSKKLIDMQKLVASKTKENFKLNKVISRQSMQNEENNSNDSNSSNVRYTYAVLYSFTL